MAAPRRRKPEAKPTVYRQTCLMCVHCKLTTRGRWCEKRQALVEKFAGRLCRTYHPDRSGAGLGSVPDVVTRRPDYGRGKVVA